MYVTILTAILLCVVGISCDEPPVSEKSILISNPSKASYEFATTVSRIEGILMKGNEVENLNAIKSVCGYLRISNNNSEKLMFTTEQLKEIDACSNVREIFRQFRFHLRWDDHHILTAILDRLDSEECEELLAKFQSKIDCQMKLEQIFEECKNLKQDLPEGFDKMVAIVIKKYSRITKEEYDQLKCFITDHCKVESYVLSPFLNMSSSSLLLEWLVPSTAITHMVETANKHKHVFIKESFVFLQIATTVILDIKSEVRIYYLFLDQCAPAACLVSHNCYCPQCYYAWMCAYMCVCMFTHARIYNNNHQ